jgi:hypothetical protein
LNTKNPEGNNFCFFAKFFVFFFTEAVAKRMNSNLTEDEFLALEKLYFTAKSRRDSKIHTFVEMKQAEGKKVFVLDGIVQSVDVATGKVHYQRFDQKQFPLTSIDTLKMVCRIDSSYSVMRQLDTQEMVLVLNRPLSSQWGWISRWEVSKLSQTFATTSLPKGTRFLCEDGDEITFL